MHRRQLAALGLTIGTFTRAEATDARRDVGLLRMDGDPGADAAKHGETPRSERVRVGRNEHGIPSCQCGDQSKGRAKADVSAADSSKASGVLVSAHLMADLASGIVGAQ